MKKKIALLSVLAVSFACAAGGGALAVQGKAEDAKPVVGSFVSWDGYTFSGTSSDASANKTVISYQWTSAGYYLARVNVSNYTVSSTVELSMTSDADATIRLVLFEANGWNTYGSDAIAENTGMTANTEFVRTIDLSSYTGALAGATTFDLGFYFDMNSVTGTKKNVTVNKLTVGGVSYQAAEYTGSADDSYVAAPETSFKSYTEWTAVNGSVSQNTLESMPETDERYATAVSEGAGNFTVTDVSADSSLTIPLSETLTAWPTDWTTLYVKVKANNVSQINAYIESVDEAGDNAFCFGLLGAWNCTVVSSVSEGYKYATVDLSTFFSNYINNNGSISKVVFVPVLKDGADSASFEIAGMTFGTATAAPVFINDVGTPALEIGDWRNQDGTYTIEQEGSLAVENTEYKGLKISYTKEQASLYANICADVSNFDAAFYPVLHIGFYTDSDLKLGIYRNWDALQGHTEYTAGYHTIELDMSACTEQSFILRFYLDSGEAADFEGAKTVVFDAVYFRKTVSVAMDDATSNGLYDLTASVESVSWSYDGANAGLYYCVGIPVDHWYSLDRYIMINITLSADVKLGIYYNSGSLLEHVMFSAGTYNLCLDTAYGFGQSWFANDGDNVLNFYCDVGNPAESSVIKTVTVNSITFGGFGTDFVSSPDAGVVTIDYATEKVTFESDYEVSADEDFASLMSSGDAVVPGTKLYVRLTNGASAATTIAIPARPVVDESSAPTPTVGENFIRFGASGYEYKFGTNGEWTNLGSWGNLDSDTEYTVYIRIVATETSFASEIYEMKVSTTGGSGTSTSDSGNTSVSARSGCGSVATFGGLVGMIALVGGALFLKKRESKKDE